jgi:hypothetical protein
MKQNTRALLVVAVLFSFGSSMIISLSEDLSPFDVTTVVFGITNLLSVLNIAYLFIRILGNNSKKSIAQLKKGLIPSFVFSLLATLFIALTLYYSGNYVLFRIKGWGMENFINRIGPGAIISLSIGLFICCVVFFYTTWRQAIDNEQKLREENLKYQYKTLKTQVNPHFLFNSLNTLSELVYEEPKKADSYIQKLSGIYRYILDNEEMDLVPLEKEITFIANYFQLQQERDGDKIALDINIPNIRKYRIVPVSLQTLVENALKHNSASENNPLKINIYEEGLFIVVSNNIQKKNILENSYGTGLSNLKKRIKLITGKEMIVSRENNEFIVKIHVIDIQDESIDNRR